MPRTLRIETAAVFEPLLAPARYKGAWGGRGGGKSHFFGELLIEDALREPGESGEGLRAVCIREVQQDLAQSSKLLLESKLKSLNIGERDGFKTFRDVIQTPKDGLIIFKGMNDYTSDSIKSLEGFRPKGVAGVTTLANGQIVLILDVKELLSDLGDNRGVARTLFLSADALAQAA